VGSPAAAMGLGGERSMSLFRACSSQESAGSEERSLREQIGRKRGRLDLAQAMRPSAGITFERFAVSQGGLIS
jgi:hypothetical protein